MLFILLLGFLHIFPGNSNEVNEIDESEYPNEINLRNLIFRGLGEFAEREQVYSEHRSDIRFVQYNQLSQDLALDSRFVDTIKELTRGTGGSEGDNETIESTIAAVRDLVEESDFTRDGRNSLGTSCSDQSIECEDDIYRSINGLCNNLAQADWGAAGRKFIRSGQKATYDDGVSIPRGGLGSSSLPSPRTVSAELHHEAPDPNNINTEDGTPHQFGSHMLMQFGHFLGHDITLSPQEELDCCHPRVVSQEKNTPDSLKRCFNIDISEDKFYQQNGRTCHSFTRSDARCSSSSRVREQFNSITSFIDGSNIYGSDSVTAAKLRAGSGGRLRENKQVREPALPTRSQCGFSSSPPERPSDLVAGDERAIVQPGLTAVHTLFLREHNRIADELIDRMDDFLAGKSVKERDDIVYHEARRLVIAELQNIVYSEYLPLVLGRAIVERVNIDDLDSGSEYNEKLDPSIMNEFATAAMRFGHSTVSGLFKPIGHNNWPLKFHYFDFRQFVIGSRGDAFENELLGMAHQPCQKADLITTDDMTDFLFFDKSKSKVGDDIMARNIQRGRDHGIPTYNSMRKACKLRKLTSFRSRPREISSSDWSKMAGVYSSVNDIDLITGGLAESSVSGGVIGPTFACILGKQFNALMFGDRYFFTHSSGPGHRGLPVELRREVRRRTLRDVMCENTDIGSLQRNVMKRTDRSNLESSCNTVNEINWDVIINNLAFEEEEEESELVTQPKPTEAPTKPTEDNRKPQPQPAKPNPPKPKPNPVPVRPDPPKPKPQPNPVPVRPNPPQPKPQPPKPKPQPPRPVGESTKCVKDKLSFCQWKIPSCATSEKTRRDCCKSCGGRHG